MPVVTSPQTPITATTLPVPLPVQLTPASTSDSDSAATDQTQHKPADITRMATSRPAPAAVPAPVQLVSPVALGVQVQQQQLQAQPVAAVSSEAAREATQGAVEPKAPKKHNNVYRGMRQRCVQALCLLVVACLVPWEYLPSLCRPDPAEAYCCLSWSDVRISMYKTVGCILQVSDNVLGASGQLRSVTPVRVSACGWAHLTALSR